MHGIIVTGRPLPCGECRTPFMPSTVGAASRKGVRPVCPRCRKVIKARKAANKQKKENEGDTSG